MVKPDPLLMKDEYEGEESHSISQPHAAPRGLLLVYLLHKIALKPAHGYEILQDIEAKTNGAWRPGAGSIYPILKKLLANGFIETDCADVGETGHKVYSITSKGLTFMKEIKKNYSNAGQRWSSMRGIFLELMENSDLSKFFTDGVRMQSDFAQEIFKSKGNKIPREEAEYTLKEYILILERQLAWANQTLSQLKNGSTSEPSVK
jgi:DNA-binding PadR family transcriptional regulator